VGWDLSVHQPFLAGGPSWNALEQSLNVYQK